MMTCSPIALICKLRKHCSLTFILIVFLIISGYICIMTNKHIFRTQVGGLTSYLTSLQNDKLPTIVPQSSLSRKLLPSRIRKEYYVLSNGTTNQQTGTNEDLSKITSVKVAELNKTKEDVYKIHTEEWKRPANKTDPPIPSSDGRYLMNTKSCSDDDPPRYLVIVQTAPNHQLNRKVIRESWGNTSILKNQSMHIIFLLGEVQDILHQKALQLEHDLHGDLVQGAFIDSYRNLTHKSVLGLRWATEYCRQAKYVLRVDDDVFVNVFKVVELTGLDFVNKSRHMWCAVQHSIRIFREDWWKWAIDKNDFKGLDYFPVDYCNGPFSVITNDIVPELFEASKITPFFWIEDVYISGMLRKIVDNIRLVKLDFVNIFHIDNSAFIKCFTEDKCDIVASFSNDSQTIWQMWLNYIRQYRTVTRDKEKEIKR